MKIEAAGFQVGQRGDRLSERRPADAASGIHGRSRTPARAESSQPEIEVFADIEQGSPEWFELRRGIPTASRFAAVCATGKDGTVAGSLTRSKLMRVLAGEILTGEMAETFRNDVMDRGNAMETEARERYERTHFVEVHRIGFIRRKLSSGRWVGCSPDGFVSEKKALEIKTTRPDLLIEILDRGAGGFPTEHRAQLQGTLWITDLQEIDLYVFYRNMRAAKFTVQRDEAYIRDLADSVTVFDWELHKLIERLK